MAQIIGSPTRYTLDVMFFDNLLADVIFCSMENAV